MGNLNCQPCSGCRSRRPEDKNKWPRSAGATRSEPRNIDYSHTNPKDWLWEQTEYGGSYSMSTQPEFEEFVGKITKGIQKCRKDPAQYQGVMYQTEMVEWPEDQQKCKLVKRTGSGLQVKAQPGAGFTYCENRFQALAPAAKVKVRSDRYTDSVLASFQGQRLGKPKMPGRGEGIADIPGLKIIGDVSPDDIAQGGVGDCWMLSAISSLAEFDGAVAHLFRKTNYGALPRDDFNQYTVTLWDVSTWEEVDIKVDERLCTKQNGSLLGSQPSIDGELWVPILEKALAGHCGGWNKIDGGQCTHAWRLLVGCKEQYTINLKDGGYSCWGAKNANTGEWEELANSPHDGFRGVWPMAWPEVGGGGDMDQKLSGEKLFERMCEWDDNNFIMGAGTQDGSDKDHQQGIVDGHAYTVLTCLRNVADSGINLVKVRNPWGQGEFQTGKWVDDGPGWDEYPDVRAFIDPVKADDGTFWMEKDEFFQYFQTIYLCAKDMSEFIGQA